jgi:hypothetical protein
MLFEHLTPELVVSWRSVMLTRKGKKDSIHERAEVFQLFSFAVREVSTVKDFPALFVGKFPRLWLIFGEWLAIPCR